MQQYTRSQSQVNKRKPLSSFERRAAWRMTKGYCWFCGQPLFWGENFHVDHLVPVCKGGTNESDNLVPSCVQCNLDKGSKDLDEWREELGADRWPYEQHLFDCGVIDQMPIYLFMGEMDTDWDEWDSFGAED